MIKDQKLLAQLKRVDPSCVDAENNLILPETMQWKKLLDDDFYRQTLKLKKIDQNIKYRDAIISKILDIEDHRLNDLIKLLYESKFRNLPDACKFPSELFLNKTVTKVLEGHKDLQIVGMYAYFRLGIVIGHFKYQSYFVVGGFDYDAYQMFLKRKHYINHIPPKCFETHPLYSVNSSKVCYLPSTTLDYNDFLSFKIQPLWNEFNSLKHQPPQKFYHILSKVSDDIEIGISHCFTFGQFQYVFLFLKNFNFLRDERGFEVQSPDLFQENIYFAKMGCSFNCPAIYHITVDLVHQLVFIHKTGQHMFNCDYWQRRKGYRIVKRIEYFSSATNEKRTGANAPDVSIYSKYKLGFDPINKPNTNQVIHWNLKDDYTTQLQKLNMLILHRKKFYTDGKSKDLCEFSLDQNLITQTFRTKEFEALIIGSRESFKSLADQTVFQLETYKCCAGQGMIALLAFEEPISKTDQVGCYAFLNPKDRENQLSIFIRTVKAIAKKISNTAFQKLEHVETDSWDIARIIKEVFPTKIHPSVPVRKEQMFGFLDDIGSEVMLEAMMERNPITCMAKVDALISYYTCVIQCSQYLKAEKEHWACEAKRCLPYVVEAKKLIVMWASSFREILTRTRFTSNTTEAQIINEFTKKADETIKRINRIEAITISQTHKLQKLFDMAIRNYLKHRKKISPEIIAMSEEFEEKYRNYTLHIKDTYEHGFGEYNYNGSCRYFHSRLFEKEIMGENQTVLDLLNQALETFRFLDRHNINNTLLKLHHYEFMKPMTSVQEYKFNEAYRCIHFKKTKLEVYQFQDDEFPVTEEYCGCNRVSANYIPCEHMMYILHQNCITEVTSSTGKIAADVTEEVKALFEKKMNESVFYKRLASKDMKILPRLYKMRMNWIKKCLKDLPNLPELIQGLYGIDDHHDFCTQFSLMMLRGHQLLSFYPFDNAVPPQVILNLDSNSREMAYISSRLSDEYRTYE